MADSSMAERRGLPFYRYVRAAYHEAGHAVMAHLLGRRFYHVTVFPEGDSGGHMAMVPWEFDAPDADGKVADIELETTDSKGRVFSAAVERYYDIPPPQPPQRCITAAVAEREILIGDAGAVAWAIHSHQSEMSALLKGGLDDWDKIKTWKRAGKFEDADMRRMERRVNALLHQNWQAVEALAIALMTYGWIQHSRAVEVIEAALAP